LGDTLDFLRACHRRAPFLFFNGNTFADIGRTFSDYLFAELPSQRRRQATSAVAHFIAACSTARRWCKFWTNSAGPLTLRQGCG
jgi:hypothetical protein